MKHPHQIPERELTILQAVAICIALAIAVVVSAVALTIGVAHYIG